MNLSEQIGAAVIALLGGGGGALWVINAIRDRLKQLDSVTARMDSAERCVAKLDDECRRCRIGMNERLESGTSEFGKTHLDILRQSKESALLNAELRSEIQKGYVSEATFKDRIIATMVGSCKNCRNGGGNE